MNFELELLVLAYLTLGSLSSVKPPCLGKGCGMMLGGGYQERFFSPETMPGNIFDCHDLGGATGV
jgi:hypothetical protein